MSNRERRFRVTLATVMTAVLGSLVLPAVAHAAPLFNGTYTAVQKSFTIDPRTGARMDQPDQVGIWIVSSNCTLEGCTAHAVKTGEGFDMVYDGTRWNRLAVPQTGTCRGATVPARSAAFTLLPQSDGSLSGFVTSTVECDGVVIDSSLPITLTPS